MPFSGDARFFTRDSGLFSRALQSLGIESRPVMPGPAQEGDMAELMRVPYKKLEEPDFWKSLGLDGLILYSWAAPRYLPVAQAVKEAGIPFLVNVDSCGLVSRPANPSRWWIDWVPYLWSRATSFTEAGRFAARIVDNLGFYRVAQRRLETYQAASVVCGVSPLAVQWLKREACYFGRPDLANKIFYLPHPQLRFFSHSNVGKEKCVISVARWEREDWAQKNPAVLLKALDIFLRNCPDWKTTVIGTGASKLAARFKASGMHFNDRAVFIDFIKPPELVPKLQAASIACWSSRGEGQIGAGAQALCCGCSVVAGNAGTLSCFHHYVSRESGRLALGMSAEALAEALILEAAAWESAQRDPERISRIWCQEFHEGAVAARAMQMLKLAA